MIGIGAGAQPVEQRREGVHPQCPGLRSSMAGLWTNHHREPGRQARAESVARTYGPPAFEFCRPRTHRLGTMPAPDGIEANLRPIDDGWIVSGEATFMHCSPQQAMHPQESVAVEIVGSCRLGALGEQQCRHEHRSTDDERPSHRRGPERPVQSLAPTRRSPDGSRKGGHGRDTDRRQAGRPG